MVPDEWRKVGLGDLEASGALELGRGQIISKDDLRRDPGPHPVYSSSGIGDGVFGRRGSYMFDEDLVTWSIDGGGRPFLRTGHKFSVTNVGGFLRVRSQELHLPFLFYAMVSEWKRNGFDYQSKAHPSVLRLLYKFALPPLAEQRRIAAVLQAADAAIAAAEAVIDQTEKVKRGLVEQLLTRGMPGRHTRFKMTEIGEVPESWEVTASNAIFSAAPKNGWSPAADGDGPHLQTFSIAAVRSGRVAIAPNLKVVAGDRRPEAEVRKGDILIVRGNANQQLVGSCGIVHEVPPPGCIFPDLLIRVSLVDRVMPEYFVALWNSSQVHSLLTARAKTTNGTLKVNQTDICTAVLAIPPTKEQADVVSVLRSLDAADESARLALAASIGTRNGVSAELLSGRVRVA